jgi:hypothetical protein
MPPSEPPTLVNVVEVVFPDINHPLPVKLVAMAALAWIVLAPVWIGVAARRGSASSAIAIYAIGAVVAAVFFTAQSGMMGESFTHRIGVWARHVWWPLFGTALVLSLIAVGVGRMARGPQRF